jgi:hypothetical protein
VIRSIQWVFSLPASQSSQAQGDTLVSIDTFVQ